MMCSKRKRALVACVSAQRTHELSALLESMGHEVIGCATDGAAALEMVQEKNPDLLLGDAVLPRLDGVMLAEQILAMPLLIYPGIILMMLPGYHLPKLAHLSQNSVTTLVMPTNREELESALLRLEPERRTLPEAKAAYLSALMETLGVPDHCGRSYLIWGISLVWMDGRYLRSMKGVLYPAIARKFSATPAHVERAIRHVIDLAWQTGEIEHQHRIFGNTIDARRGRPTCGEMIAQLADILRWEGRL